MTDVDRVILVCLTHGSQPRLGEALRGNVDAAKKAIGELPAHRGCFIDVIPASNGVPLMPEALKAQGYGIFPHVTKTGKNCPHA